MEQSPAYQTDVMTNITANQLVTEFFQARADVALATVKAQTATRVLSDAKNILALVEAVAIDAWLGKIAPADLKTAYGSNAEDRARNTLIYLASDQDVLDQRETVRMAEIEAGMAQMCLDDAKEALRALHSVAWAYGGECARDAAVIRAEGIGA